MRPLFPCFEELKKVARVCFVIFKACFELGFGVAKWFNLIVAITGLHKTQVSNWVRQRRYHLRKLGQFPPVPQTVNERSWAQRNQNKENDFYFPERSIAVSRKRRRTRSLSAQPKAKRLFPMNRKKERVQPGSFHAGHVNFRNTIVTKSSNQNTVAIFMEHCFAEAWGLQFGFDTTTSNFVVTRVDLGLQAHEKGIKIGWTLKRVNDLDATPENRDLIGLIISEQMSCYILFQNK